MSIHQLVLFWRDTSARCFTAWHFQAAPRERATTRAYELWQAVSQLTHLQIYGAVLDTTPLRLTTMAPVPETGITTRLQVSLSPANPKQVGSGQLRFSIPGPTTSLARVVTQQEFTAWEWQLIEQELIPYLCSPTGVKVSVSPDHLHQAEIVPLTETQLGAKQSPLEAALLHTQEALKSAQHSYQQLQTPKVAARVEKYQTRLAHLQHWQAYERECFEQISQIATMDLSADLIPQSLLLSLSPISQEAQMTLLPPTQNVSQTSLFLPIPPPNPAIWQDVPADHFTSPQYWVHRTQLREWFNLNERSYYRWINEMKQYGLERSLPASGNARVTLFYRSDIEAATARATPPAPSSPAAPAIATSVAPSQQPTPSTDNNAQLSLLVRELTAIRQQQQALTQSIARLETNLAEQRQTDLDQINQQFANLSSQQATISTQQPQGQFLDLLAQLVNLNQLPTLLRQLTNAVQKMATPRSPRSSAKAKPASTTKTKKKNAAVSIAKKKTTTKTQKKQSKVKQKKKRTA